MKKSGLGKGLDSLISKKEDVDVSRETLIRISEIEPNKEQPRKLFDDDSLTELAESIKEHGVIQPIIVVKKQGFYRIVAGERRWRAAKIAGLNKIPVIIKEYDDKKVSEIALIENIQREGLNPIEEAEGINDLMTKHGITQENIAKIISKSRPYVTNSLRLLKLPEKVRILLAEGELSTGHARCLIGLAPQEKQIEIAEIIIENKMSVRETEEFIKKQDKIKPIKHKIKKDTAIYRIEQSLEERFKVKIEIKNSPKNKGKIQISYNGLDELERIIELLKGED